MTLERRADSVLPRVMADLAKGPYPDYIDDVLATTSRTRQRPAWVSIRRWLPLPDPTQDPVLVTRVPWRTVSIALLVVALLLAALVAIVGSQRPLPQPFGPARNGAIAYATGDIYVADPSTGESRAVVSGPETDLQPRFSLDGSRIAFERQLAGGRSEVYVVGVDGSDLTLVTPEPINLAPNDYGRQWERFLFSPDGLSLLIHTLTAGQPSLAIARTDGSGFETLDLGMAATEASWRPPVGAEIVFAGNDEVSFGLFAFDVATRQVRSIIRVEEGAHLAGPSWSPDGSRLTYWSWDLVGPGLTARSRVVNADGRDHFVLPMPEDAVWNAHATWSNDGRQLFIARAHSEFFDDVRGVVLPADGSSVGVEVAPAGFVETSCCAAWMWSPDDTKLLGRSAGGVGTTPLTVVIDIATTSYSVASWPAGSDPTWQRLAP